MTKITVTFEGEQAAGKTRVADLLRDALLDRGGVVIATVGEIPDSHWLYRGIEIEIIERQI